MTASRKKAKIIKQEYFPSDALMMRGKKGDIGIPIELRNSSSYLQWKYATGSAWTNLIATSALVGGGQDLTMQVSGGLVEYQNIGETEWHSILAVSDIVTAHSHTNYLNISASSLLRHASNDSQLVFTSATTAFAARTHTHASPAQIELHNLSMSSVSNGLTLSAADPSLGGVAVKGSGVYTQASGTIEFKNANSITFGLSSDGAMTASFSESTHAHPYLGTEESSNYATSFLSGSLLNTSISSAFQTSVLSLSFAGTDHTHSGLVGLGTSTGTRAGTEMKMTMATGGLSLEYPNAITSAINVALGGNTLGTLTNIVDGVVSVFGGDNITLSQQGNSITFIGQSTFDAGVTGISGIGASNTTFASGTIIMSAQSNITIGTSVNGASQYLRFSIPDFVGTSTAGTNVGLTVNSLGINASIDTAGLTALGDGVNIMAAGSQSAATTGYVKFVNSNSITFGMSNSSDITASFSQSTHDHPYVNSTDSTYYAVSDHTHGNIATETIAGTNIGFVSSTNGLFVSIPRFITTGALSGHSHTYSLSVVGNTLSEYNATGQMTGPLHLSADGNVSIGISDGYIAVIRQTGNLTLQVNSLSNNAIQNIAFSNSNNVSFGISNGTGASSNSATITAMANLGSAPEANHTHGSLYTESTSGVNILNSSSSSGLSLYIPAYITTAAVSDHTHTGYLSTAALSDHTHSDYLTTAAASNHSHGNPTLNLTGLSGTTASASNGLTISLSASTHDHPYIASEGLGNLMNTSERAWFFHTSNNTFANNTHTHGNVSLSLSNISGTYLSASNGLTISLTGATGGAGGAAIQGSGTYSQNTGTVVFQSSNSISFGLSSDGVMTASFSQSVGSLFYTDSNGISFSAATSSLSTTIQAFYSQKYYLTGNTLGASSLIGNDALWLSGGDNITLSATGSTLNIQAASGGGGGVGIAVSGSTLTSGNALFSNANQLSFGMSGSTITANHALAGTGATVNTTTATDMAITLNSNGLAMNTPVGAIFFGNIAGFSWTSTTAAGSTTFALKTS